MCHETRKTTEKNYGGKRKVIQSDQRNVNAGEWKERGNAAVSLF